MSAELIRKSTLAVGFGVICCLFYYWGWSTEISSFGGDSAGYMMAAQYYSPYQPASSIVEEYSQRIIYPPLFPWLLAMTSGGTHVLAAHLMVITFLLAALIPLYLWLRNESFSPSLAAAVTVLFAAMPSTRYISMSIWTENVYLFFSLMSVWAVSRASRDSNYNFWYIAAAAIACATSIRVAAMPLLLAFGIYLSIKKPRNWPFLLCAASIPIAIWLLFGNRGQTGITGYTDVWQQRYNTDSTSFLWHKLIEQLQLLRKTWIAAWISGSNSAALALISQIFGLLGLSGFAYRLKCKHFDAIYILIYLSVLLAWHSSGEVNRYAYIAYPFIIGYAFIGFRILMAQANPSNQAQRLATGTLIGLLAIVLIPPLLIDLQRRTVNLPFEVQNVRQTDFWYALEDRGFAAFNMYNQAKLIEHFKAIRNMVPENECIFSVKPPVLTFYAGRSSYRPPLQKTTDQQFDDGLKRCNYVYTFSFTSLAVSEPHYPLQRLGNRAEVISIINNPLLDKPSPVGILAKITH